MAGLIDTHSNGGGRDILLIKTASLTHAIITDINRRVFEQTAAMSPGGFSVDLVLIHIDRVTGNLVFV